MKEEEDAQEIKSLSEGKHKNFVMETELEQKTSKLITI